MIALVTTYFLIFYILVPGVLFRFLTSWFVPLKLFERTRTQEAAFAVAVALIPFSIALFGVWEMPVMKSFPFPIPAATAAERHQDYRRVAIMLTSSDASRLLLANAPLNAPSNSSFGSEIYWQSVNRVLRRQARFLSWYFALICLEGVCFGLLARRYGDWQSKAREYRFRLWLIRTFILPNISEWHLLLTGFYWPKKEKIAVSVDILQNDGFLYQGRVADYFLDSNGKLTGILLENVNRFDREAYFKARGLLTPQPTDPPVSSAIFWKAIPGSRFYIGQNSIANLNVRFVARDQTLISLAEKILDADDKDTYDVVVASEEEAADTPTQHPDVYS